MRKFLICTVALLAHPALAFAPIIMGLPKIYHPKVVFKQPKSIGKVVIASFYGPRFHGRLMANGKRFNQWALTAAHKKLPLGTKLKVTSLDTGKSVVVTITDRGPFIKNRTLDLSKGAALELGMIKKGIQKVMMEVIA